MPRKMKAMPPSLPRRFYLHGDTHDTDAKLFWCTGDGTFHDAEWFATERYLVIHQQLYDLSVHCLKSTVDEFAGCYRPDGISAVQTKWAWMGRIYGNPIEEAVRALCNPKQRVRGRARLRCQFPCMWAPAT
jgi:hypothetical protein